MGLHESVAQVQGQMIVMDPLPPISMVFALVSQEEHQWKVDVPVTGSEILLTLWLLLLGMTMLKRSSDNTGGYNSGDYKRHKKRGAFMHSLCLSWS